MAVRRGLPYLFCIIPYSIWKNNQIIAKIKVFILEYDVSKECMLCFGVSRVDYVAYIRDRITKLRMEKNVSEYQMSLELGQNKNYIQGISSGKSLPSMKQFLNICDYFGITPMQFFDNDSTNPQLIRKVLDDTKGLNDNDLLLLLSIIQRLHS